MRTAAAIVASAILTAGAVISCANRQQTAVVETPVTLAAPSMMATKAVDYEGVHNLVTYTPKLVSGSAPETKEAFETLASMGVKTVISVDGAEPFVDLAKAKGMKYIHLPIGYDGVPAERQLEIAKAVQEGEKNGLVYLHCHHGKHRSAGACGTASVMLGYLTNEQAESKLKVSGTAAEYKGLYASVEGAKQVSVADLAKVSNKFPEVFHPKGMVKGMVEVDLVFERLKEIQAADWKVPTDHPDLVPVAEAGRLADLFRNMRDDAEVKAKPSELSDWLLKASKGAESLESGLLKDSGVDSKELSARFKVVGSSCKDCHVKYRN